MDLARLIKTHRIGQGLSQAELADYLKVSPQTVSRWENGQTRPREVSLQKLDAIFGGKLGEYLSRTGPITVQHSGANGVSPPVVTRVPLLPLGDLSPENFELFYKSFLSELHPTATISRIGSQGDTQYGIDLLVDFPDGTRWTYQCKRHKSFGKAKVAEVVRVQLVPADRMHLVLSRVATSKARLEMSDHTGWTLLDGLDISDQVRRFQMDRAARLIDIYFGGPWRAEFLGIPAPGPWLTATEFFSPLEGIERTFTHSWTLVGRKNEVKEIVDDLINSSVRIIVLSAPGGSGKSRLIKEVAANLASTQLLLSIRFASPGMEITGSAIDSLPAGETILIIDDVHDRKDFPLLLQVAAYSRKDLKLLLVTRPFHRQRIRLESAAFGFDPKIHDLQPLKIEDHVTLASEILENLGGDLTLANLIAELTKDSPLATAVGSSLVARHSINPRLLANDDDFRRELMRHFQDVLLGSIPGHGDGEFLKELLHVIALVQPITWDSSEQQEILSDILNKPTDIIARQLISLRESQVLLQRGSTLRIVPDLLADYIVANECLDARTGNATGYADRILTAITSDQVFNTRTADLAEHLLTNLAKLDWRLAGDSAPAQPLLANIWNILSERLGAADPSTCRQLILTVSTIAYFQPRQAVQLVKSTIEGMLEASLNADEIITRITTTDEFLKASIVVLLRNAAYGAVSDPETLDEICNWLWQLGRRDARPLNQTVNHPIRILGELAGIAPGKPFAFCERILAEALTWFPSADDRDVYSVFDVVDVLLATEGHQTESLSMEIRFSPYTIIPAGVESVRMRIVQVALGQLSSTSITRALRAAATLETALRPPLGMFNRVVTDEEVARWKPQMEKTLALLKQEILSADLDAYVRVRLFQAVRWHARNNKDPDLRRAAREISKILSLTPEFKINQALVNPWDDDTDTQDDEVDSDPRPEQLRELVNDTCATMSVKSVTTLLISRLATLQDIKSGRFAHPETFVGYVVEAQPLIGVALAESALTSPGGPASTVFHVAIAALALTDSNRALDYAHRALRLNMPEFNQKVSFAYGAGLGNGRHLSEDELVLIENFAKHDDFAVRMNASWSIRHIHNQDPARALAFVLAVKIDDSEKVAEQIFSTFGRGEIFDIESLPRATLELLLGKFLNLSSIDEYGIRRTLQAIALVHPDLVVDFLIGRVRATVSTTESMFDAVPRSSHTQETLNLRGASNFQEFLRRIRDLTLDPILTEHMRVARAIQDLFGMIAGEFDGPVIEVLQEWVSSGESERVIQVALLLDGAPFEFLFRHHAFVEILLNNANELGAEVFRLVQGALLRITSLGNRGGTIGQPFPQDVEQRDRAHEIGQSMPDGSLVQRFYEMLENSAIKNIEHSELLSSMDEW